MPTGFCSSGAWSAKCGVALRHGSPRHLPGQEEVMEPVIVTSSVCLFFRLCELGVVTVVVSWPLLPPYCLDSRGHHLIIFVCAVRSHNVLEFHVCC
jgi:hypothetical protein